ncbi:TolB-like translocation protein [Poritiphilus flavus]|uniref:Exo-alpha-sialidase n=1 Tax=Poritiphilus flavus TaxID=2697053 RepID=A0A6L9E7F0_9FLAO|nr:PD40 domain-containing protein [Poritiphilus flavus]NAS10656.1 exo-alpha-sialidase [Poritiphilus flavus]
MDQLKNPLLFILLLAFGCQQPGETPKFSLDETPGQLEIFGEEIVSTSLYERDFAISPNRKEIVFTLGNYKQSQRCLVSIKKEDQGWGSKQILPFSGKYNDIEPFFSVDGKQLFFASNRPMDADTTRKDYNIWSVERGPEGWGDPVPLDTLINTSGDEFYPALGKSGNLYFTATRKDGIGREDIFLSTYGDQGYQKPVPLDSTVNTAVFEFNAYVDPDEELLIFSAFGRKDGNGGGDLYFSKKTADGGWAPAKNMGELVNSDKLDYCPFLDQSNGNFYFTSDRAGKFEGRLRSVEELQDLADEILNGMGNIYRLNTGQLDMEIDQ